MAPRRPVSRAARKSPFPLAALTRNSRLLGILLAGVIGVLILMVKNSPKSLPEVSTRPTVFSMEQPVVAEPLAEPLTESVAEPAAEAVTPEAVAQTAEEPSITPAPSGSPLYIALIIDDIGYSGPLGERAIALPGAVTYAVLPHTPFGTELAELAHSHSKEVMLHAPMSNLAHQPLGPGALTDQLNQEDFIATLKGNIDAVPHLQGINNHMGSELTGMQTQMQWVMEVLKERGLYFVDSYTTAESVAGDTAREQEIPTTTRNVFLDNETTAEDIDREFQRLLQTARENGSAVGIGHPYEETLDYLEKALPALAQENIQLISVSEMIRLQNSEAAH
jgi:polysaccharide deacetylase 2 family uncharacterized protein YibQ